MMFDKILEKVNEVVTLSKEEKEHIKAILKFKKLNKREFLLKQGEIEDNYYFVISGCLRSYINDKKGVEQVLQFSSQGWWIADNESILLGKPTKFNIVAATDSEILILSKKAKDESVKKFPKLEKYYNESLERSVIFLRNRLNEILSFTAEERYLDFCKKFPELKDVVSQKHIASYIGVTPEFFSSMKKKIKDYQGTK
ncbi:Crp/Fnr family transcriptional regulator [Apibacter raozihei]|uniref:Crp/Fnr family transcriptional regulator n=1 Tax=Apibacter TaxID=1778601 RepID=UPI000FE2E89C|nr:MULTISPECIES: Crp/Fnr family transcriptional regulator [Apibacter]